MTTTESTKTKTQKTTKSAKPAAAKSAKAPKADKAPRITKKQQVADLLKQGTSIAAIVGRFACSPVAAKALIGDVRRVGAKVEFERETATYKIA